MEFLNPEMGQPLQDPHTSSVVAALCMLTKATGHFQCDVFSCGDFTCVAVTILVLSRCRLSDGERESMGAQNSFTTSSYQSKTKDHCVHSPAPTLPVCTDITAEKPSAAGLYLYFGLVCYEKGGRQY